MYAIFKDGARQFTVKQGDIIDVDLRDGAAKAQALEFKDVVFVNTGKEVKVGTPNVASASVKAEILVPLVKAKKVVAMKFRRRKNSRTKRGHRQKYTRVKITAIQA